MKPANYLLAPGLKFGFQSRCMCLVNLCDGNNAGQTEQTVNPAKYTICMREKFHLVTSSLVTEEMPYSKWPFLRTSGAYQVNA